MLTRTSAFMKEANLIGGKWVAADSGDTLAVTNPATGAVLGTVPNAGQAEAARAIEAAATAFERFRKTTAAERAAMLRRMHDVMIENVDALAELLTLEQGKPLAEAKGEITVGANYILWFAEEGRRVYGDIVPSPWADRRILVRKEPVGVVGAITPWNFPSSMLARKIGPAIAAGCTAVIKPASQTPYSGLAWGVIAEMAGLPEGVMNIVTGSASQIGGEMTSNPAVKKITFTGSTDVGKILLRQCADTVKKVSMELGGNAPFLVFDSADVDKAVEGAVAAKYRNSGQTCVCTNRFYVQAGVYDEFAEKLARKSESLKVGPGTEEGTQQGPLIDMAAVEKVEELIADAVSKGGKVLTGGNRHELGQSFFQPTVIANATAEMRFSREEIFGPVSPIFRFETEEEAIALANDTEYGLACYFYTRDLGQAFRVMEGLDYGLVGVNEGVITTPEAPFGGHKESGLGSEGGREGILEYLDTKYVCIGGLGL
ncbi:NAD-dependent succinate-semialdehyde dehydrogenase [Oricola thermophila]|uniref:NAD-dependent succinate-semialdehyde dehydrogenase n=1 Tax=Oricola thermophila TaxID=2742145 RepID=A0A6N1VIL6_9HYPH|nr:NAD-dependent succinate-semialdehyde dehydrogenase [Oricola thermophila]QKV19192.1 NAD-dependent succinate-semialdehyde dehydrogenase [Oricola thermophila]